MELIEAYIKAEKGNIYYTKNSDMFLSMVKSIFISKNIPVRVYFDTIKQLYVFGNAFDYIHADLASGMKYYSNIYAVDEMRANISYLKQNCALFQILPDDDLKKYDMGDGYTHGWILPYEDMFFACRNNEYKKVRDEVPLFKDKVGFWQGTEYYEHQKSQQVVNESVEPKLNDNFWKWFKGSKIVDEKGKPLICYHGTTKKFNFFDKTKIGKRDKGWYGKGFYFTPDYDTAYSYYTKTYSGNYSKNRTVMPCYLSIKNPYIVDNWLVIQDEYGFKVEPEYLKNFDYSKYDGIVVYYSDWRGQKKFYEIIAFEPNQIKSVENNGEWSESDDIYESLTESIEDNANEKLNSKNNCKIILKDGKIIYGKLLSVNENYVYINSNNGNRIKKDDIKELYMYYDCEVILKNGKTIYGNFVGDYGDHKLHLDDAFNRKGWAIKDEVIDKVNYKRVLKKELNEGILGAITGGLIGKKYNHPYIGAYIGHKIQDKFFNSKNKKDNKENKMDYKKIIYNEIFNDLKNKKIGIDTAIDMLIDNKIAKDYDDAINIVDFWCYEYGLDKPLNESVEDKILYIIRGVPGSGKSTLAHKLTDNVVEADQYFYDNKGNYNWSADKLNQAHNWCFYTVKKYMEEGRDKIAVANTFVKNKDYKRYVELAKEFGYKVDIRTCTGNYQNIHNVPDETVEKMRSKFQETPLDESVKYLNKEYSDTRIITSDYDMRDYLINHKNLRIVYDKLNKWYFVNDSEKAVHFNIMSDAIKAGFYNDYKVNSGIDLLLSNYYEQFVVFVVNDGSVPADAFNADDYTFEYKYNTFNIYDRDGQFINCPLYQILGMPNETNRIDGYNEDEDNENYYDEDEEEQLDESAENDKTLRDYAVKLANICLDALVKTKYETRISKEQIQINVDKAFKKAVPMLKYSSYEYFLLLVNEKDEPNPSFGKTVDKKYGLITFPIFSSDPSDLALSILYKHKSVIEKLYTTYSGDELKLKIHEYAVKYLKNEIKKRLENKKNIYLDLLIHECTHLLDDVRRTKTYKSKEQELKDDKGIEDYYNSPEEQNAYYQETISIFDEWANQSVGYKTFDIFWDDFIRQYKGEYNMLNDKNKRKLKKRAYAYWDVYMKD